jgi:aspartate/methionine/tyrosine aminotransferase
VPFLTEANRLQGIELSLIRRIMQAAPPDAINLALGELGFPLPEFLRSKALELLRTETPFFRLRLQRSGGSLVRKHACSAQSR